MSLDRGPWTSLPQFAISLGENELQWAESHAKPRINPHRSMDEPETPAEYIHLLKQYLAVAPYLVSELEHKPTLSHPDLHLDNIFIDPKTNEITSIIDWQSAAVAPLALQCPHPQLLDLSPNPLTKRQQDQEKDLLKFYYEAAEAAGLPRAPSQDPYLSIRISPLKMVSGCWERKDVFSLRQSLINVVAHWERLCPEQPTCPISFTPAELQAHKLESELIAGLNGIMQELDRQGLIPLGGMVPSEYYDGARLISERCKKEFMDLAENEEQRRLHEASWPY